MPEDRGSRKHATAQARQRDQSQRKVRSAEPYLGSMDEDDDSRSMGEAERFSKRVVAEALPDLLIPDDDDRHIEDCEVNVATLQRMNIHAIQRELIQLTSEIVKTDSMSVSDPRAGPVPRRRSQALELRELMKEYCTAWRDWDLMVKSTTSKAETDPFRLTTHTELTSILIQDAGLLTNEMISKAQGNIPQAQKLKLRLLEPTDCDSLLKLPGGSRHSTRQDEKTREAIRRFIWAMGGCLALVAPMIIMVLHKTLLTTLLTSSVAVTLLAFSVAVVSSGLIPGIDDIDLGPKDVLAITATYAAVLVVFIGTNS